MYNGVAAALPSLQIEAHYQAQGYRPNGPLFDGSALEVRCFKERPT
jgi:hypothetical protein